MKLFGWLRKKDPPPSQLSIQNFQKSDATKITRSSEPAHQFQWEGEIRLQTQQIRILDLSLPRPSWDVIKLQVAGSGKEDECMSGVASELCWEWEDGLLETIQFVFSHQEQGMLAIGTLGLNQISGVLDIIDRRPHISDLNNSLRGCVSSAQLLIREVRSLNIETESFQSNLRSLLSDDATSALITRKELPVFGDHDASSRVFIDGHVARGALKGVSHSKCAIPIILMCQPNSVEMGIQKEPENLPDAASSTIDCFSDKEVYSSGVCGLFTFRRRTPKLDKEWVWNKPLKKQLHSDYRELLKTNSTISSTRGVWRLCRSGNNTSFVAKIVPDKQSNSPTAAEEFRMQIATEFQDPACTGNNGDGDKSSRATPMASQQLQTSQNSQNRVKDRCGERIRRRSFGKAWACTQHGKWIRTDSEFVVLEM